MNKPNRIEDLRIDADKTQLEIARILHCQREVYADMKKVNEKYQFGLLLN